MLFSVIIPTFNRARFLSQTLDTVFAQTLTDNEIIVVDDGSTDETQLFLTSLGSRVIFLSQSNQGPGAARNLGARHAKGDYLAFLDSDDLWFPWTLSCFAELIRRYDYPTILRAKVIEFSRDSDLKDVRASEVRADAFSDYFASHRYNRWVGAGMSVLRRDWFLSCGGYTKDISNSEDHDLMMRLGEAGGFVEVVEPITLAYRRHSESVTQDPRRSFEGACYLVRQERSGSYPGGIERSRARRAIITQRTRPVAFTLARNGMLHEAWQLYRATFAWNLALSRWRYLGGFPARALLAWLSSALRPTIGGGDSRKRAGSSREPTARDRS